MNKESSIYFLINPRSGGRKTAEMLRQLKKYSHSNSSVIVDELNPSKILDQISKASAADIIVIGGGDGTISKLLPNLSGVRSKIAILPLGTGNDLARELNLLSHASVFNVGKLIKFYHEAASRDITYFKLEYGDDFKFKINFINYVSFGFDAKVVGEFAKLREGKIWRLFKSVWMNRLGYALICLLNGNCKISGNPAFVIKNDKNSHELSNAKSIIFTNICSIMGLGKSNLHSSLYDNNLECVVVNGIMNYIAMLIQYKLNIFHPEFIGSAPIWNLSNLPSAVHVQIDGEYYPDIVANDFRITSDGKINMIVGSK